MWDEAAFTQPGRQASRRRYVLNPSHTTFPLTEKECLGSRMFPWNCNGALSVPVCNHSVYLGNKDACPLHSHLCSLAWRPTLENSSKPWSPWERPGNKKGFLCCPGPLESSSQEDGSGYAQSHVGASILGWWDAGRLLWTGSLFYSGLNSVPFLSP